MREKGMEILHQSGSKVSYPISCMMPMHKGEPYKVKIEENMDKCAVIITKLFAETLQTGDRSLIKSDIGQYLIFINLPAFGEFEKLFASEIKDPEKFGNINKIFEAYKKRKDIDHIRIFLTQPLLKILQIF